MTAQNLFYLQILVAGYFLWLGLYLISRALLLPDWSGRDAQRFWPEIPAGVAMVLTFVFMTGIALEGVSETIAEYVFWARATWWSIPLVAGIWLWWVLHLADFEGSQALIAGKTRAIISTAILLTAAAFSLMGPFTSLIFRYDEAIFQPNSYGAIFLPPAQPFNGAYSLFFMAVILSAQIIIGIRWRMTEPDAPNRPLLQRIFWGNVLMVLGASSYLITYQIVDNLVLRLVGDLLATLGLAIVGRMLVRYGAWLRHRFIQADMRRSFLSNGVLVVGSLIVFDVIHRLTGSDFSWVSIPILIVIGVFTATMSPFLQVGLDRWVLPSWEVELRHRLNRVEKDLTTAADPQQAFERAESQLKEATEEARRSQQREMIRSEVRRIFRHKTIYKERALASSPLLNLHIGRTRLGQISRDRQVAIDHLTAADRAQAVRELLDEGLGRAEEKISAENSAKQIPLIVLRQGYLEDKTRPQVAAEIQEATGLMVSTNSRGYTTYLNHGRKLLAETLWQMEIETANFG